MNIFVKTLSGDTFELKEIKEIYFNDAADAACACLSVSFLCDEEPDEINEVKAFNGNSLIFTGFCDCQKTEFAGERRSCYIYARSSAALLLDNEAKPFTYLNATAASLYDIYAEKFGFKNALPDISCEALYEVQKGSSCFGAINLFVSLLTGKRIYVTPENEIVLLESDLTINARKLDIIKAVKTINRSEPLSSIKFKRDASQYDYSVVTRSEFGISRDIKRDVYINLATLPEWQRDYMILKKLKASYEKYKTVELTVKGYVGAALFTNVRYTFSSAADEDYILYEKQYCFDEAGERTKLGLRKKIDIREITYVDKQTG